MLVGDFRRAYEVTLEDSEAVNKATIAVENIAGPVLLVSGELDPVWPSTEMSNAVVDRLSRKGFRYPVRHIVVHGGDHIQPQRDYHDEVVAFLDQHFKPRCRRISSE
jgi:pimeloyl-ACP methyl ester carboxylesterase